MKIPAEIKSNELLDLLCDAVYQYRLSHSCTENPYRCNRHARSSILSSAISLESAANGLLSTLNLTGRLAQDFDKLPVISKFEIFVRLSGCDVGLDRGCNEVQRAQELLNARNGFVHPKQKTKRKKEKKGATHISWKEKRGHPYFVE